MQKRLKKLFFYVFFLSYFLTSSVLATPMTKDTATAIISAVLDENKHTTNNKVTPMECAILAPVIKPDSMRDFSIKIGLSEPDIDTIVADHQNSSLQQRFNFLLTYSRQRYESTLQDLINVVLTCDDSWIYWENFCQRINDIITLWQNNDTVPPFMAERLQNQNVHRLYSHQGNITEAQLSRLASRGLVTGSTFWPYCLGIIDQPAWEQVKMENTTVPMQTYAVLNKFRCQKIDFKPKDLVKALLIYDRFSGKHVDWDKVSGIISPQTSTQTWHSPTPSVSSSQTSPAKVKKIKMTADKPLLPDCKDTGSGSPECLICFDHKININISCGHGFCRHCIDAWILQAGEQATCPTCRKTINTEKTLPRYE
ncbi:hypothetical protein [Endozoicomonas sp. Mp262]|uniref:RING-HC finger protein n=1 Tax=Endozoicomonas sp. Mp262 TaxID=2919499 RepID=UPI0021DB6114